MSVWHALRPRLSAFLCLRAYVLASLLVLWNALWIGGRWLNGWTRNPSSSASIAAAVIALSALAAFMLAVAYNPTFAERVIEPTRKARFHQPSFVFLGILTGFLALFFLMQGIFGR